MKRFYKIVSTKQEACGFSVLLDGKPVKTKEGHVLSASTEAVANALMQEWASQEEHIDPETMPLTQILNTKLDRVSQLRPDMTAQLMKFLDTDLLCYLAPEPEELIALQSQYWTPWRDWFEKEYKTSLETTTGLAALKQTEEAHQNVLQYIEGLNDEQFTVLQMVVPASGSLILGLAFVSGQVKPDDIMSATFAEEDFKDGIYDAERYGADPMLEKKKAALLRDLEAAELLISQ